MASVKSKTSNLFLQMLVTIRKDRTYFPKVIDQFWELNHEHRIALVRYLMDQVGKESWKEWAADPTQHVEIIKALLMAYTGRKELDEPSRIDLAKLIGGYTQTKEYREIEISLSSSVNVTEALENL